MDFVSDENERKKVAPFSRAWMGCFFFHFCCCIMNTHALKSQKQTKRPLGDSDVPSIDAGQSVFSNTESQTGSCIFNLCRVFCFPSASSTSNEVRLESVRETAKMAKRDINGGYSGACLFFLEKRFPPFFSFGTRGRARVFSCALCICEYVCVVRC